MDKNSSEIETRITKLVRLLRALRRLTAELTALAVTTAGLVYFVASHWPK